MGRDDTELTHLQIAERVQSQQVLIGNSGLVFQSGAGLISGTALPNGTTRYVFHALFSANPSGQTVELDKLTYSGVVVPIFKGLNVQEYQSVQSTSPPASSGGVTSGQVAATVANVQVGSYDPLKPIVVLVSQENMILGTPVSGSVQATVWYWDRGIE